MLWPLLILGYAVLVTSRPSSSIADDLLDGVTWRVLPSMLRQESSQWMSPSDRPEPGNVTGLTKTFNCIEITSTGGTTVINEFFRCERKCLFSWRHNPFGCIFHSPVAGFSLLIRGFLITHNDAPQSVGLLWTSDQSVAKTSI